MKKTIASRPDRPAAAIADRPEPKFTPRGGARKRLLIAIADNKIDFAGMDPEATKSLNELLHNPEVQAQFSIGPMSQKFDPEQCKRLYQAIGKLMHTGARVGLNWPERAAAALEYDEQEQTELAKPTATVLDELAPKWLQENQAV